MIEIRPATERDAGAMAAVLNPIIRAGGTTAIEEVLSAARIGEVFLGGDGFVGCHVALDEAGSVAGFQWLGSHAGVPEGCADIATFARMEPKLPGVGRALFEVTRNAARVAGFTQINATIRADNRPGLGYYAKMGFVPHSTEPGVPLKDGTPVDRLSKRFVL